MSKYKSVYGGIEQTPLAHITISDCDRVSVPIELARGRRQYDASHGVGAHARRRLRLRRFMRRSSPEYQQARDAWIQAAVARARPPI